MTKDFIFFFFVISKIVLIKGKRLENESVGAPPQYKHQSARKNRTIFEN
jgi:hypothetical protein